MVILGMPKELYEVMYRMVQSLLKFIKKKKTEVCTLLGLMVEQKREDSVRSSFNHLKEGDGRIGRFRLRGRVEVIVLL